MSLLLAMHLLPVSLQLWAFPKNGDLTDATGKGLQPNQLVLAAPYMYITRFDPESWIDSCRWIDSYWANLGNHAKSASFGENNMRASISDGDHWRHRMSKKEEDPGTCWDTAEQPIPPTPWTHPRWQR